jgi:hypothetical protein
VAILLGSPNIRVHVPRGKTNDDISCAVEGLNSLAQYSARKNIVINLKNDDPQRENPYHRAESDRNRK